MYFLSIVVCLIFPVVSQFSISMFFPISPSLHHHIGCLLLWSSPFAHPGLGGARSEECRRESDRASPRSPADGECEDSEQSDPPQESLLRTSVRTRGILSADVWSVQPSAGGSSAADPADHRRSSSRILREHCSARAWIHCPHDHFRSGEAKLDVCHVPSSHRETCTCPGRGRDG